MTPLPMGLLYIATSLKNAGHNVMIVDAHSRRISNKRLLYIIREFKAEIVGITGMTSETPFIRKLCRLIKTTFPKVIILLGGPHISSFREIEFIQNRDVDFGIVGEGERSTVELIRCIEGGETPKDIKGVIYREGEVPQFTGEPEYIDDLDSLPLPDYSLLRVEDYFKHFGATFNMVTYTDKVVPLMYSRGCPFRCRFCHNIFGKRIRYFGVARIVDEIRFLRRRYDIREIDFLDDTINANQKMAQNLFENLLQFKKEELVFAIPSGVRGDLFSDELLSTMKELGIFRINIAYESAVQRILDEAGKNLDIDKTIENTYKLKEISTLLGGFFMFGFPSESEEDINATVDLACSLPLHTATFSFVTPFPETDYYQLARRRYSEDYLLKRLMTYDTFYSEPVEIGMLSSERLMSLKKRAIRRFYLNPRRIFMNTRDVPNYYSLLCNGLNVLRLAIFKNVPY